jgi:hypothetical protein
MVRPKIPGQNFLNSLGTAGCLRGV